VSGVRSENVIASLKPMIVEGFIPPDNVQKKELFSYYFTRSILIVVRKPFHPIGYVGYSGF
jgi:hypothetical protein